MLKRSSGLRGEGERTMMVIFFGANDAAAPDYHMHVPVDEYGENLRAMARRCKEMSPGITLVFVSPPPVDVDKLVEYVPKCQSPPGASLPVVCLPAHADCTRHAIVQVRVVFRQVD